MLHFPNPVKLTGWNATGGLLGRKDERLFLFSLPRSSFLHPPPPSPLSSHDSSSLLSLLFTLVSLCCFYASCMFVCMRLDSYVMQHHSLWCVGTVPWHAWVLLTCGQCISASWQLPKPCGHLYGPVTQQPSAISLLQCPRYKLLHALCAASNSWC